MEDKQNATEVQLTELPPTRGSEYNLIPTVSSDMLPARSWPKEPLPLEPEKNVSLLLTLIDASLIFLCVALIVKIALVIYAWKTDSIWNNNNTDLVSGLTIFLIEFNSQMVTAFTIIFVTIVSTLVKRWALWKAEKGAYVSDLEQLQGSVSMVSTFKLIWSLRAFSPTSIGLVVIWSFYYLGSQSSQREYLFVNSASYSKLPMALPSANLGTPFSPGWQPPSDGSPLDIDLLNTAYTYADMVFNDANKSPSTYGTDTAGNALIPDLHFITGPSPNPGTLWTPPQMGRHGWYDVSKQSYLNSLGASTSGYSAITGATRFTSDKNSLETESNPSKIVGKYTFQTQYFDIHCAAPISHPFGAFPNNTLLNQTVSLNMTSSRSDAPHDTAGNSLKEFEVWSRWEVSSDSLSVSATNTSNSSEPLNGSSSYLCNITQINVDVQIRCKAAGCVPYKMRYRDGQSLENATSFSTPFDNAEFAQTFFSNVLLINGPQTDIKTPTAIGKLFYTPVSNVSTADSGIAVQDEIDSNWASGGFQVQTERTLVKTINTYYTLSQQQSVDTPHMDLVIKNKEDRGYYLAYLDGALYDPQYAIFWPWIAVDFVSCLILLGAAIMSTWLRLHTLAPDIFGYVSSLTRDNPHVELPNNGTTLNGIERALMLKRVKVKIGDVSAPEEPNRIGLARADSGSRVRVEELRRTAAYV